jgi:pyruvate dehydrogenase complex dehydrogenase (E1) component
LHLATGQNGRPRCTTITAASTTSSTGHDEELCAVEDRVLWLATGIVDHANRVRPNPTGLKVGGHQASSVTRTCRVFAGAPRRFQRTSGSPVE